MEPFGIKINILDGKDTITAHFITRYESEISFENFANSEDESYFKKHLYNALEGVVEKFKTAKETQGQDIITPMEESLQSMFEQLNSPKDLVVTKMNLKYEGENFKGYYIVFESKNSPETGYAVIEFDYSTVAKRFKSFVLD